MEEHGDVYRFDEFRLDLARGTLRGPGDAELVLRPKAFALLRHLLEHPGRLLGREELLDALWPDVAVTDDSLTQCVGDLRRALGDRAAHVLRTLPRRGYVLIAEVRRDGPTARPLQPSAGTAPRAPLDTAAGRSAALVVHPFECADGNPASGRLAGALTTDLVSELARFEGLRVVVASPDTCEPDGYRVRGEVRAAGTRLRATVRFEDAATGVVLWVERLDHPRDDEHDLPEEPVAALAATLQRQVDRADLRRARQKPPAELSARELCLLGREHHGRGTEADTLTAREMFDRAITADPDYAPAYAWQAYTVHRAITHGWGSPGGQVARDLALRLARRAVQIEPDSPLCLARLAFCLLLHQRWDEAVATARTALGAGRPADYASRNTCSEVLAHAGYSEEAVEAVRRALSLDPHCPPTTRAVLGRALVLTGRQEEALPELRWCAARLPDYFPSFQSLVVAATETGRHEEAGAALREVSRLQPDWVPRNHTGLWFFRRPEDAERFQAAFRVAGLAASST